MPSSIPILLFPSVLLTLLSTLSTCSETFAWNHSPTVVWAPNCDFPNSDIGNARIPDRDCSAACRRFPGCTHFAWTTYSGGTCFFKHQGGITTASAISESLPGTICGILKGPPENVTSMYSPSVIWARNPEVDNPNISLCLVRGVWPVSGKDCSAACERVSKCTHFAWTRHKGGTCWFSLAGITPASAITRSLPGTTCGILKAP